MLTGIMFIPCIVIEQYIHSVSDMNKDFTIVILFVLLVYPLLVVAAKHTQSYAIFQSRGASFTPPKRLAIDEAVLTTPDGERLHAWWLQTKDAKRTVLYFQGNGTNVSHKIPRLKTFRKMGINALLIDYRGYGKSTGRVKNEVEIYTDGLTAWNFLTAEKGIDPEDIIIWGRSLGGGVATEIARFKDIAALVLESTFYSLDEIAKRQYWFLPTTWLLNFHFENGRKLKQVTAPVVIIHSVEDDYIPFLHADRLFEAASVPKYIIATTGSHWDSFDHHWTAFGSGSNRPGDREASLSKLMEILSLEQHYGTYHPP